MDMDQTRVSLYAIKELNFVHIYLWR